MKVGAGLELAKMIEIQVYEAMLFPHAKAPALSRKKGVLDSALMRRTFWMKMNGRKER